MARVLIVDDDEQVCTALSTIMSRMGYQARAVFSLEEAMDAGSSESFDLVLLDVWMPDGNGLEVLPAIKSFPSSPEVIIITGYGDVSGAKLAIQSGAWDYIRKPLVIDELALTIARALQYKVEKKKKHLPFELKRESIIGSSDSLNACLDLVAQAAMTDTNVLIQGETGTGKELFARAIHDNSARSNKNLVVVDCTTLPGTLAESILFGHEKGAFTGADRAKKGLVEYAHGGTLFLDEIGELSPNRQKSFLRVLEERRFRPLGSSQEVESDFRLVVATNRNLDDLVGKGEFREDLFYRLKTCVINLPPLRYRTGDIAEIAAHYVKRFCGYLGDAPPRVLSPCFLGALSAYRWPGNVRELVHTMEKVLTEARRESVLFARHLPDHIRIHAVKASLNEPSPQPTASPQKALPTLQERREARIAEIEKEYLQEVITLAKGNVDEACRLSGLSRSRFYTLLRKYSIRPPRSNPLP